MIIFHLGGGLPPIVIPDLIGNLYNRHPGSPLSRGWQKENTCHSHLNPLSFPTWTHCHSRLNYLLLSFPP